MFAGTATTKIASTHHDWIFGIHLARFDETIRVKRFGQSIQREAPELLIFFGNRRNEIEILGGDDLVGVDIIAHDVNRTGKDRLHRHRMCAGTGSFSTRNYARATVLLMASASRLSQT